MIFMGVTDFNVLETNPGPGLTIQHFRRWKSLEIPGNPLEIRWKSGAMEIEIRGQV
jgi:methyl coenzyme M reductase subunit D